MLSFRVFHWRPAEITGRPSRLPSAGQARSPNDNPGTGGGAPQARHLPCQRFVDRDDHKLAADEAILDKSEAGVEVAQYG